MTEQKNRDRRRAGGNGGKVEGGRAGGQLSTVSTGLSSVEPEIGEGHELRSNLNSPPDPEVPAKASRRQFSAQYKLRVLEQVEACTDPGEVGRLLRREGLYSSHLTAWRKAKRRGSLEALEPKKRGAKALTRNPLQAEVVRLQRRVDGLEEDLRKAHLILDVQGKVAGLLGLNFGTEKSS
jgi:transposase-like protein